MDATKSGPTREQDALRKWQEAANLFRTRLAGIPECPSLLTCFDLSVMAGGSLGMCELNARSLERAVALDVYADRRDWLQRTARHHNDQGLIALREVRRELPNLEQQLRALKFDAAQVVPILDAMENSIRHHLADWDMKASDATKLMAKVLECTGAVRNGGIAQLCAYVDNAITELDQGRQRPDRGTQENIPWWKIMFLSAMFGWLTAGSIVLAFRSGKSPTLAAEFIGLAVVVIAHWFAFLIFC